MATAAIKMRCRIRWWLVPSIRAIGWLAKPWPRTHGAAGSMVRWLVRHAVRIERA